MKSHVAIVKLRNVINGKKYILCNVSSTNIVHLKKMNVGHFAVLGVKWPFSKGLGRIVILPSNL